MAMTVSAREAHARFAGLLDRASRGETIIITRRGEEIARLIPGRAANELLPGRIEEADLDRSGF